MNDEAPFRETEIEEQIDFATQRLWSKPASAMPVPELRLIEDLQRVYPADDARVAQALERVRRRLAQKAPEASKAHHSQRHSRMSQPDQEYLVGNIPPRMPAGGRQRTSVPGRLVALAAALLLVVLVGGLITGLVLVRQKGNGTTHPSPLSGTPPGSPISTIQPSATVLSQANLLLSDLRMTSATTGWTVATPPNTTWGKMEAYKVLHISDGGRLWQDVTPHFTDSHTPVNRALPIIPLFLDDSTAWMLDLPTTIYQTVDSGRSWQVITTPAEVVQYTFIDRNHGWVLGTDGGLYQTHDDGKTWTKLQSMRQGQSQPGILPYNVNVTGLFFLNARDGWMTGQTNQTNSAWVYVTHDGGQTWQHERLPLPAERITPPILVTPPSFVGDQDGFLWVNLDVPQHGGPELELYTTHDGGATWQDRSVVPGGVGVLSFSDGSHGWVSAQGTTSPALWMTGDGGQHWSHVDTSPNLVWIGQLDFVSATTGWAISIPIGSQSQVVLKTEDGGHTWIQIPSSITG